VYFAKASLVAAGFGVLALLRDPSTEPKAVVITREKVITVAAKRDKNLRGIPNFLYLIIAG
jgi:hypothetical protein